jgi:hypothetical protein
MTGNTVYLSCEYEECLSEMLGNLAKLTQADFCGYAFANELLRGKIPYKYKMELTLKSIDCGRCCANEATREFGYSAREIAEGLNLQIQYADDIDCANRALFACHEEPDIIILARRNILMANHRIKSEGLESLLEFLDIEELLLAHEIFHHYEMLYSDKLFTRKFRLLLWKIGPLRSSSRVVCLSEIGAMAFAKELARVSYSPFLLDILFLWNYSEKKARETYRRIMANNE